MNVLDKIDALRKERGWSLNNLAMEAMLTQSTINNLYTRRAEPKISTLRAICGAFGITLSEFFADEQPDTNEEIYRKIRSLNHEQKKALLVILKSIK